MFFAGSRKFIDFTSKKRIKYLAYGTVVWIVVTFSLANYSSWFNDNHRNHRLLRLWKTSEDIHDFVDELEVGWSSPPPQWMDDMCPEVVKHFTRFPSFKKIASSEYEYLPLMPTEDAARSICTIKVTKAIAASINSRLYLHAGSHLGAVVHGQGMPWDDDVDLIMDFRKFHDFFTICKENGVEVHPSGVRLKCVRGFNSLKVWLHTEGMEKLTPPEKEWYSPFLDLFFYTIENDRLWEVYPDGTKHQEHYAVTDYFPTRPYYYGGIYVLGPQIEIVETRYNLDICMMGQFNHRLERLTSDEEIPALDCDQLSKIFPFRATWASSKEIISLSNGPYIAELYPSKAAKMDTIVVPTQSIEERAKWFQMADSMGQQLTDSMENLNQVEVDNSINPLYQCSGPLKVVEFNAERGRWWMEASNLDIVRDADIVILNEMDIGMARSDNQHTTRLMAHYLNMNYAWGLEFVELTPGSEEDLENANDVPDFHGLHGNAFLTKCLISDAQVFRNDVGGYFSSDPTFLNAHGTEKRLGGRMGLFGRIIVDGKETVIGSVHKIENFHKELKEYIGERNAIVAGDQIGHYCKAIGLENMLSTDGEEEKHFTWPASCDSFGRHRGDNMCSNMNMVDDEMATLPCSTNFGFSTKLGDHALISTTLGDNM